MNLSSTDWDLFDKKKYLNITLNTCLFYTESRLVYHNTNKKQVKVLSKIYIYIFFYIYIDIYIDIYIYIYIPLRPIDSNFNDRYLRDEIWFGTRSFCVYSRIMRIRFSHKKI